MRMNTEHADENLIQGITYYYRWKDLCHGNAADDDPPPHTIESCYSFLNQIYNNSEGNIIWREQNEQAFAQEATFVNRLLPVLPLGRQAASPTIETFTFPAIDLEAIENEQVPAPLPPQPQPQDHQEAVQSLWVDLDNLWQAFLRVINHCCVS